MADAVALPLALVALPLALVALALVAAALRDLGGTVAPSWVSG